MIRSTPSDIYKQQEFKDLGLGTKADQTARAMNKDGSFNVKRIGLKNGSAANTFHWLVSISWIKFSSLLFCGFIVINVFFAILYLIFGIENLYGVNATTNLEKFFEAFFFSTQTFTTVGYGRISPLGIGTSLVASLESMVGVLTFAIGTGLLYGRFSKPNAKILFSDNAIIAPYQNISSFQFRMANARSNQLIEVEVQVNLSLKVKQEDGSEARKFHSLKLEREKISLFPTNWTVVHPIDSTSPLYNYNRLDFDYSELEFFVIVKAFDDTFSQTVYARTSYRAEELIYGAKFENMISRTKEGGTILELDKLNKYSEVKLIETPAPAGRNFSTIN